MKILTGGLKPEASITTTLATGALVWAVYSNATPAIADIRVAAPGDQDIDAARKMAAWTAVGTVAFITLLSGDPNPFIFGGALVVALDWWHRHANEVDPRTGKATATYLPSDDLSGMTAPADQPDDMAA